MALWVTELVGGIRCWGAWELVWDRVLAWLGVARAPRHWCGSGNLPEQCPVGERWARQLGGLRPAEGKVSVANPGERSCTEQVETRAGNGPGKGEAECGER